MKRIITICAAILMTASVFLQQQVIAQAPETMSYQVVIRDESNTLVTSTSVGMQISILQGSATGTAVYIETQTPPTNANGLVSIEIGSANDDFSNIDWSNGPYFIKTEIDPAGGRNYTIYGTSQLLSVPYALYAKTAGGITESDPVYTISPASGITSSNIFNWNIALTHSTTNTGSVHGSTTVGGNLLRLTNPSELSFLRINADNSLSALSAANFRTAIDAGTGTVTSIATGNGIAGGTITTTGTLGLTGQALALHNLGTNGIIARTGAETVATRTINASTGITISNGNGVSGNPTIGLTGQALALHNLGTSGIIARTGAGTVATLTINAGTGITISNGNGVNGNPTIATKTYAVGDFAHGGIVFWVDATGQHGLVCAKTEQSTDVRWYAGTNGNTRSYGDGPLAGKANTSIIIAAQVAIGDDGSTYAARICNELQVTEGGKTYGDWYLPSKEELNLMFQNRVAINATATANVGTGFAGAIYWSSTEYNPSIGISNSLAWGFDFLNGVAYNLSKAGKNNVRAVRAF